MKQIISLIICLILLISIIVPVNALDISKIQPDTNIIYVGITDTDVPAPTNFHTRQNSGSLVIIPGEKLEGIYVNPITGRAVEKTEDQNNEPAATEDEEIPSVPDEEQSIEYNIDNEKLIEDIFNLVNEARKENGIPALTYNKEIQDAADLRAKETSESFSHTRPDGSSCHDVIKLEYYATGENLLMADKEIATAENMMKTWMNSEGHRANILLKDFTEMAIGIYEKDNIVYATQIFLG